MTDIKTVIDNFEFEGNFVDVAEYGSGHINKTYLVTFDNNGAEQKYILQQLNANVFKNIDQLMKNVFALSTLTPLCRVLLFMISAIQSVLVLQQLPRTKPILIR